MSYPEPPSRMSFPPYGGPPRKNRAGLIIVLLLVLLVACIGVGGYLAYGLVRDRIGATEQRSAQPSVSVDGATVRPSVKPSAKPTAKTSTKSSPKPSAKPTVRTTPRPPVAQTPVARARSFLALLNANRSGAAAAMACPEARQVLPTLVRNMTGPPTSLRAASSTDGGTIVVIQVEGTTRGRTAFGVVVVKPASPVPCVSAMNIGTTG